MVSGMINSILVFLQRFRFKVGVDRKTFVLKHIKRNKCRNILEIGVFNGNFAYRMLKVAKEFSPSETIKYVGVDLFASNFSSKIAELEIALTPKHKNYVQQHLGMLGVKIDLHEGWSNSVLPNLIGKEKFDLIIIDGGHSYETVKSDFENSVCLLAEGGSIFLDDYTNKKGVLYGKFGINQVVSEIDTSKFRVSISFNRDFFYKPYGVLVLRMVKIQQFVKFTSV
jgi:predicted O-methyltransferase YrrM